MQTVNLKTCNISVTQNPNALNAWIEEQNAKGASFEFGPEELHFICSLGPVVLLDREVSVCEQSGEKCFVMFMDKSNNEPVRSVIINDDHMYANYTCVYATFPELNVLRALNPALALILNPEYA